MLVFTRKLDQGIVIADGIEVKILRIGRDGVRIGVTAAPHVPVHRREVYEDIRRVNTASAGGADVLTDVVSRWQSRVSKPPAAC